MGKTSLLQGVETIPRRGAGDGRLQFQLGPVALAEPDKGEQEPDQLVQGGAQPGAHQPQAHGVAQQPAGAGPDEGDADKGHQGGELGIPRAPQAAKLYHLLNLHEQHHTEDAHDHGAIVQNDGVVGIEQENLLAKEEVDKAHDAGAHQAQALAHAAVDFRHIRALAAQALANEGDGRHREAVPKGEGHAHHVKSFLSGNPNFWHEACELLILLLRKFGFPMVSPAVID